MNDMYDIGPFEYLFARGKKKIFSKEKLTIGKGEFILISGDSGSGKSTFLQILKGIIPEFKSGKLTGEIRYQNESLSGVGFQKNLKEILFLFQNPFTQLLYKNASEEFLFSMENYSYSIGEMDQRKNELENFFQISSLWNKKTSNLSHGECQRLVLASLMAVNPSVLLLDEPTAFLDPEARSDFYQWLLKIKGNKSIILIDHHVDEILPLIDRVITVDGDGEISEKKSIQKLPNDFIWPVMKKDSDKISLSLSHVYFHYKDQSSLLKDINLRASSGDIIIIRGKNGKGKSTLFKLMAGLEKPLQGEIEFFQDGNLISQKKWLQFIGFVFQNPETHFFYDTIDEELYQLQEVDKVLFKEKFFNNTDFNQSPFLLSEGEKRRLSLLITVYQNRAIIFYDEPTFGQDKNSIEMIRSMILAQKKMGKIQFIISHDEAFISSLEGNVYELSGQTLKRV